MVSGCWSNPAMATGICLLDQPVASKQSSVSARVLAVMMPELCEMEPVEAELCKLMTNAWRYIQFATVNQFYMIATEQGLDFNRILHGCRHNYPRMAGMPGPGFAADMASIGKAWAQT